MRRPTWGGIAILIAIAIGDSAFFGASLAVAIPRWDPWKGAAWLTLSAGTGWLLFIPCFFAATRRPFLRILYACLIAMAVGEAVLALGAIGNFMRIAPGPGIGIASVAVSNVAMVLALTRLLREEVSPRITLALWMLVLDGVGSLAFWAFYRLLFGGKS